LAGDGREGRSGQASAHLLRQLVRKDERGKFVWPGYGDNSRVLKWIVDRLEGRATGVDTAIGHLPAAGELDISGLDLTAEQLRLLLSVDAEIWRQEASLIPPFYEKFGERLPKALWDQYEALVKRLATAPAMVAAE
jgi:phosphoenolpyruvate carboxykinase (GTP)